MKTYIFLYLILSSVLFPQTKSIIGKITNSQTGKPVPYANIGVEGTTYGTCTNEKGKFKLILKDNASRLVISCVGFETKKIDINVKEKNNISVKLEPVAIKLPEVIVNAKDNPAYEIIRKAIAAKEKNRRGLENFSYNFYSKNILKSGKEIVFIEEDIGKGFKEKEKDAEETKTKITMTKNVSGKFFQFGDLNFLEKKIIDFTKDSLKLGKFVFHLPLSKFAFDYYDYKLLGIEQSGTRNFFKIKVIPLSEIRPTFAGEIFIDDSSYSLTGLNLNLNSRNLMPFTEFKMSVHQNLHLYKKYWLPKYFNIDVHYYMNYYNLISLDSALTSYIKIFNNFNLNLMRGDSLITKPTTLKDSTLKINPAPITPAAMDSLRLYPLSALEKDAYKNIDSSKKILSSLKLGGLGGKYVKTAEIGRGIKNKKKKNGIGSVFKFINYQNNRVDGITLGLKHNGWIQDTVVYYSFNSGYAFARKKINANLSLYLPVKNFLFDGIKLSGNYGSKRFQSFSHYPGFWNSAAVTLGFEDQFNYMFSKSAEISFEKSLIKNSVLSIGFITELQKSLEAKKYYSIFNSKRKVRTNPLINEGYDNRIILNFSGGKNPLKLHFMMTNGFTSRIEIASKHLGANFNYTKFNAAYLFYVKTMFNELFFSPYLGVFIEASAVFGSYGIQHLYTPQTALGIYSPFGSFKALQPYELLGNKSIAMHLEHNWRKIFFDMLGLYFPVSWNIELTTGINGLAIWSDSKYSSGVNKDNFYWEVYGGISGILGIVNINVAYNKYKRTVVRFGFSKFF